MGRRAEPSSGVPIRLYMRVPPLAAPAVSVAGVTVYIGDALRVLRALPSESVDAVVCDPPYAIKAVRDPGIEHRISRAAAACSLCSLRTPAAGYDTCAPCLDDLRIAAFTDAAMLGQQSANWHERATHSRGYADNDNTAFGLWVGLWASECLRLLKPGGHLVAFGGTRTWHRLACGIEDAGFEVRDSLAWLYSTGVPKSLDVGRAVADRNAAREPTAVIRAAPTGGNRTLKTVENGHENARGRWGGTAGTPASNQPTSQ